MRLQDRAAALSRFWAPWIGAGLLVALLATLFVLREYDEEYRSAQAELEAVSALRQQQIENWLAERLNLARFIATSTNYAILYDAARDGRDPEARRYLLKRLVGLRRSNASHSTLLVDDRGQVVAQENEADREVAPELRAVLERAFATSQVLHTGLYRQPGHEPALRIDVVIPLRETGTPPRAAIVWRLDPGAQLQPSLNVWPAPRSSGETILWRREGGRDVALSDLRLLPAGAAAALPVLREGDEGAMQSERPFEAVDYRGRRVLAVARPISGTDLWLVSKLDRDEIEAPPREQAWRVAAAALAFMALLAVALRGMAHRRALREAVRERAADRERLQALQMLEAISEHSGDAVFVKDLEGRYVFFNRSAAQQTGVPAAQALGRTDAELFDPATAGLLRANDRRVIEADRNETATETLQTPRGTVICLTTKGPLRDREGRVTGVFGVARDVTERERAERALRESEAHYRSAFSVLTEAVMVFAPDGRLLSSNAAAERMLGLAPGEVAGDLRSVSGWQAIDDEGRPLALDTLPVAHVLALGEPRHGVELRARNREGELRWFSVNAEPVKDPNDGRLLAAVTSFTDITGQRRLVAELEAHRHNLQEAVERQTAELRRANVDLADAERFVRGITDNLPGRVAYWDRDFICRFANRGFYEWWQTTPEQAIGHHAREITGSEYADAVEPMLRAAFEGRPQHFERETARPGGPVHHQLHYLPDRRADGSVAGAFVLAFEITAQKRAEAALQRANAELIVARDRAEDANRAKSAFLANMSHEIRTPMNAIIGLTHLMEREPRDATQRDRLEKVASSAQHLLQIINDILDLSKIEAGRLELEELEFSLDAVISRTFEMVSEQARTKGLELVVDTDHAPDLLRGDPTRLAQSLLNLLSNAVKFTSQGWVRLQVDRLGEEPGGVELRFTVTDTGMGIPPERLATLFNAFEQVDSSTSRRHGGTGLGLALTRRLARLMGGEAGAESQPGVGSRFWFTARLGRGAAARNGTPPLDSRRVLLVDDLEEARTPLADRLHDMGLRVDTADSGARALDLAQQAQAHGEAYDVLLIDWQMAPLDGVQTLERLRTLLGPGLPPAVLITAYDEDLVRRQALAARFDDVLVKPITASHLLESLQRVLRHEAMPVAEAPRAGENEATLRLRHGGRRVLLAEDNVVNQEVSLALLRSAGLRAELAQDGREAVQMATAADYAVVLMDVQMPGMDGLEATRELRRRGYDGPVLAMTANAFGEDRAECLAAGMNDHVAKPVDPETLYATLLRWLPAARALPPALHEEEGGAGTGLVARLAQVPEIDPALALRSSAGKPEVLERVLHRFAEQYEHGLPQLAHGDAAPAVLAPLAWQQAAHSLYGACGAIGAVPLQQEARRLEAAAKSGAAAAALAEAGGALHEHVREISARIREVLAGGTLQ